MSTLIPYKTTDQLRFSRLILKGSKSDNMPFLIITPKPVYDVANVSISFQTKIPYPQMKRNGTESQPGFLLRKMPERSHRDVFVVRVGLSLQNAGWLGAGPVIPTISDHSQ